jgi:hypothetical protein
MANPAGLNAPEIRNQFIRDFQQLQSTWQNQTLEQRRAALEVLVNKTFKAAGLPNINEVRATPLSASAQGGVQGNFDAQSWRININQAKLTDPQLSDQEAAQLASNLYHEMRHAEQYFRIAQLLASHPPDGKFRTPQQIQAKLQIERDSPNNTIVSSAIASVKAQPLTTNQIQQATAWYESIYSSGRAHRESVLNQQRTILSSQKYQDKQKEYTTLSQQYAAIYNDPKVPFKTKQQLYQSLEAVRIELDNIRAPYYSQYKALPEEKDAFAVGDSVLKLYPSPAKKSEHPISELGTVALLEELSPLPSPIDVMQQAELFGDAITTFLDNTDIDHSSSALVPAVIAYASEQVQREGFVPNLQTMQLLARQQLTETQKELIAMGQVESQPEIDPLFQ